MNETALPPPSPHASARKGFPAQRHTRPSGEGHLDDLLQVPPGLLQGLHGEPGVGVGGHAEALDLAVQLGQLVEVGLGRAERGAEGVVGLTQGLDLFQGVAAHRVC